MTKTPIALLLLSLLTAPAVFADLPVGPVYPDQFPTLDVAIEPPGLDVRALGAVQAEELELLEDGVATSRALAVRPFGATERGIALVVAIDVSGTMTGKPLAEVKKALSRLVEEVRSQDRMTLVTFADEFRPESQFTNDPQQLREVIAGIEARGRTTELFKALFKSLELFNQPDLPARRRLVVVSDGKDEGEAYRLEDVLEKARSLRVPVDSIGLTRIDPKYLSQLERLADLSNGFYARASEAADLERLFGAWMARLQATPVATFKASRLTADGQPHRVGARWRTGSRALEGDIQVLVPSSPPPSPPSALAGEETEEPQRADAEGIPRSALVAGGLALLVLIIMVALWLARRTRPKIAERPPERTAPPAPSPRPMVVETPREPKEAPAPITVSPAAVSPAAVSPIEQAPIEQAPTSRPRRKTQIRTPFTAPAAGQPAAILKGVDGALAEKTFDIEVDPFWIGSEESNQMPVDGDDFISGNHACIRFHEGSLLLYDNGSTNGTFLNEERVADTPRSLTPGDRVRFGRTSFVLLGTSP